MLITSCYQEHNSQWHNIKVHQSSAKMRINKVLRHGCQMVQQLALCSATCGILQPLHVREARRHRMFEKEANSVAHII